MPGLDAVASLLALGAGGTGLAFLFYYTLIAEVGPARAAVVAYIAPAFAVVYGVVAARRGRSPSARSPASR